MRILAIDTSTSWCSVALSFDGQIKHRHELIGAGASQHLLPWINELLHSVSAQYQDLDTIAVGIGPGAFSGVRLSVAIAQGLAVGAKRPVIPVASLDAMAMLDLPIKRQSHRTPRGRSVDGQYAHASRTRT